MQASGRSRRTWRKCRTRCCGSWRGIRIHPIFPYARIKASGLISMGWAVMQVIMKDGRPPDGSVAHGCAANGVALQEAERIAGFPWYPLKVLIRRWLGRQTIPTARATVVSCTVLFCASQQLSGTAHRGVGVGRPLSSTVDGVLRPYAELSEASPREAYAGDAIPQPRQSRGQ